MNVSRAGTAGSSRAMRPSVRTDGEKSRFARVPESSLQSGQNPRRLARIGGMAVAVIFSRTSGVST